MILKKYPKKSFKKVVSTIKKMVDKPLPLVYTVEHTEGH